MPRHLTRPFGFSRRVAVLGAIFALSITGGGLFVAVPTANACVPTLNGCVGGGDQGASNALPALAANVQPSPSALNGLAQVPPQPPAPVVLPDLIEYSLVIGLIALAAELAG